MTAVLVALADVGPGVQLEEQLGQAGLEARWEVLQASGPRNPGHYAVVIVDADFLGDRLTQVTEQWRDQPAVPGVVAIGSSAAARAQAPIAKVTLVTPSAKLSTLVGAIQEAAKLRLASGMRWAVLRAASKLPPIEEAPLHWAQTLAAARKVDIQIPHTALRWNATHYATPTDKLELLKAERLLTVPELEVAARIDGTLTVQRLVGLTADPEQMARYLWILASMGAIELTPEVRDVKTPVRRLLSELRAHLRARTTRLERATYYDVLEVPTTAEFEDIEEAYRRLALRFSPELLGRFDLALLQPLVLPLWEQVEKARSVLVDHAARGRYHDWLRDRMATLTTVWAVDPQVVPAAADAFRRGQASLGTSDVHRAMSELAMACRLFPGHPEYEANLAWARYRVQVAAGKDKVQAALVECKLVEEQLHGCRPWPRALVALALLAASGGDVDSARWHLSVALQADPTLPAAQQLAVRLGMRR